MITANYISHDGYTAVRLNYPKGPEYVNVKGGIGEAERLVYYHNRKYILKKMYSWLNQRKQAIKLSPDKTKIMTVARLQVMFSSYQDKSLFQLCKMVHEHKQFIESIAPPAGSHHYNYYIKVITSIIQYCSEAGRYKY